MKNILPWIFIFCAFWTGITFAGNEVALKSELDFMPSVSAVPLNPGSLTVGVYRPLTMPSSFLDNYGAFRGLDAEYIALLTHHLNIRSKIKIYNSRELALTALGNGEADIILTSFSDSSEKISRAEKTLYQGIPILKTQMVAVTNMQHLVSLPEERGNERIATLSDPVYTDFIKKTYPQACVKKFSNIYSALSSVERGENDMYIGNNLDAGYYLTNDFSHTLEIKKAWEKQASVKYFLVNSHNTSLYTKVSDFCHRLSLRQKNNLLDYWLDTNKLLLTAGEMPLTEKEKQWVQNNPTIKVLANPYYAPLTMMSTTEDINGVAGDLIQLISLKTGLKFDVDYVNTENDMADRIKNGQWEMIPAATATSEREKVALFSNSYLSVPYVFISRHNKKTQPGSATLTRIAVPNHFALYHFLQKKYPQAIFVPVGSSTQALTYLIENKADIAVANKVTARFFIDHYFRGTMNYADIPDAPPANIAFAINKNKPELQTIINKVLESVPSKQIFYSVDKWNRVTDPGINTWNLYRREFYSVSAFLLLLIASSLVWAVYLQREVRKRKVFERHLLDQLNYSHELSNLLPFPLYMVDLNGQILKSNAAYIHSIGSHFAADTISVSHPLFEVFTQIKNHFQAGLLPHVVVTTELLLGLRGQTRDVQHWFVPFRRNGESTTTFICGWQDMTEYKKLLHCLQSEKENAIRANEAKRLFLARMSHEIRTPVSAVMGFLEILKHKYAQDDDFGLAYSVAFGLLDVVGDVIDIEKIESGKYTINNQWQTLGFMFEHITHMFDGLVEQKQIQLSCPEPLDDTFEYYLAPQPLRQIMVNLLSNAVKFTEKGSVCVTSRIEYLDVEHAILVVAVTDSGVGISCAEQNKLFLPFSQTESGNKFTGAGLGLSICRHLSDMMGGKLEVSSEPNVGSTFTLTLPVKFRVNRAYELPQEQCCPCAVKQSDLTILIVDDNRNNRLLLKKQLMILGYLAEEAGDGKEALAAIKYTSYDLIITDLDMPKMSGAELVSAVRKFDNQAVIIGLTAHAQESERRRCIEAGMNDLSFKPLGLQKLNELLLNCPVRRQREEFPALNELFGKDRAAYYEFLRQAQSDVLFDLQTLLQARVEEDPEVIAKKIHRLSGTAQILNEEALCNQLEKYKAIDKNDPDEIKKYFTTLVKQLHVMLAKIESVMKRLSNEGG